MSNFWKHRKVLVTGGTGFIGSHVVELLVQHGAKVTVLDHIKRGKIKNIPHLAKKVRFISGNCDNLKDAKLACSGQSVVMNLAARVGGIEYNLSHQASILSENLAIASTMLKAAHEAHVDRFLVVSSACVYPHDAKVPTPESEGSRAEPEPTNGGYGWAKRMAEKLGMYYAEQYGMKVGIVRPYNAYGPRDHFDPQTSHVIPSLIARVIAGENPLSVWGSGKQTRAFLYVEDLARGMIQAIEKYPVPNPINLGTNEEISIKNLIRLIIDISGVKTDVIFDTTKQDGSPRRNSVNTKAKKYLNYVAKTSLAEGLAQTIEWYRHEYYK